MLELVLISVQETADHLVVVVQHRHGLRLTTLRWPTPFHPAFLGATTDTYQQRATLVVADSFFDLTEDEQRQRFDQGLRRIRFRQRQSTTWRHP